MTDDRSRSERVPASGNGRLLDGGQTAYLAWGLCSDPGPLRAHNEDFAAAAGGSTDLGNSRGPIFAVADGLGGHSAGEIASRVAVQSAVTMWSSSSPVDPAKLLRGSARTANGAVVDESFTAGRAGMGTTLTLLTVTAAEVLIAHVGDGRVYRVRTDSCVQLTVDHSRVGEMVRMKLITAEQAAQHPARSQLTRSLGAGPAAQIDLVRDRLEIGDTFIMCTDGLWNEVSNRDLVTAVAMPDSLHPRDTARQLVSTAVERGCADNVTAVVVRVTSAMPVTSGAEKRSLFRRRA